MRRTLWIAASAACLLATTGLQTGPALADRTESLADLGVTDLQSSTLREGETVSVGYAARYHLTEDLAQVNGTAALPTASIPPDRPELNGLPSPASGEFVVWASSPDTGTWAPQVRQVGGLYLAPQLTPAEGTPAVADAARAGDRVDFGVTHYALDMRYPEAQPRDGGVPRWELAPAHTMFLGAHSGGADGGVALGTRVAYLHANGGDLQGSSLALPDIEVPLPPGSWSTTLMNWQAGIVTPGAAQVSLTSAYDAARDTMIFHPVLTGTLPQSSTPEHGPRTNVIGVALFAYARPDASAPAIGAASSLTVPMGGRGVLASGRAGEGAAITVPIEAGMRSELGLGAAATSGRPQRFGRAGGVAAASAGNELAIEPSAGILDAIEGEHETTTGLVRYEVDADYRGVPGVTNATFAASGQSLFDGIAAPMLGTDRPLRASEVVDARVFPAAWGARFAFSTGSLPVTEHVYYDDEPMPYTVATGTAYTVGSTVDLVYETGPNAYVHLEMSIVEPQQATSDKAIVGGVSEYLGEVGTGQGAPATPVLVSLRSDAASISPGTRATTVPLSVETRAPAGLYQPVAMPAGVARGSLWPLYLDFAGGGPARSVFAQDSLGDLVLTNAAPSLPAPGPGTPPASLDPAAGLDVLVTGGNAVLLQL